MQAQSLIKSKRQTTSAIATIQTPEPRCFAGDSITISVPAIARSPSGLCLTLLPDDIHQDRCEKGDHKILNEAED